VERANPRVAPSGTRLRDADVLRGAAAAPSGVAQPPGPDRGNERRLVAGHRYFGIEARALRMGLGRLMERTDGAPNAPVSPTILCEAFDLAQDDGDALLRALASGGLVRVHADGRCTSSARLREYAYATVVAPLSRARAKLLVEHTRALAAHINVAWTREPFCIQLVAVSGSYMTRRGQLSDLRFSVVLRNRVDVRKRRFGAPPDRSDAMRKILEAIRAQSSFIVVRVVADRHSIERPFTLVYHADDETTTEIDAWDRVRSFKASISRRLGGK